MAGIDFELKRDEMERDSLRGVISSLETAIAVSSPGTRMLLQNSLDAARGRLFSVEKKIKDEEVEQERRAREEFAVDVRAAAESRLSDAEKVTYSGFLREEYFSKADFGRLEDFYRRTWDRLSDGGKDEMSRRIWEGIRRDEYTFGELPQVVQEKEASRAYRQLRIDSVQTSKAAGIPENDRMDFLRAYESGKTEEASKILERNSFRERMFRHPEAEAKIHSTVEVGREADGSKIERANILNAKREPPGDEPEVKTDLDLSGLNLGGAQMAEASGTERPTAGSAKGNRGPLLGGG